MDSEDMADAHDAALAASQSAQAVDERRVRGLTDQKSLGFPGEQRAVKPRMMPMTIDAAPSNIGL